MQLSTAYFQTLTFYLVFLISSLVRFFLFSAIQLQRFAADATKELRHRSASVPTTFAVSAAEN